jgi:hypothetical protein
MSACRNAASWLISTKVEKLKQQMQKLKGIEAQLRASPDQQISLAGGTTQ